MSSLIYDWQYFIRGNIVKSSLKSAESIKYADMPEVYKLLMVSMSTLD